MSAPQFPIVTVTGEAEISTIPDQVLITVRIETFGTELTVAKSDNDQHLTQLSEAVKQCIGKPIFIQENRNESRAWKG